MLLISVVKCRVSKTRMRPGDRKQSVGVTFRRNRLFIGVGMSSRHSVFGWFTCISLVTNGLGLVTRLSILTYIIPSV